MGEEAVMRAVILIGHGSRAAGADDDMERISEGLRVKLGGIVATCRMSGRGIPFDEAFDQCVRQGAKSVIVLPYFLHFGVHLREDIPEMLREAVAKHPEVRLVLGRHLGYDDVLVSLVEKRIEESMEFRDVRELSPAPIDCHPGEPGGDSRLE
ncbi:MAG: CbiX/SirB N-terminal domain-containing protein [Syntrophales bacterium]|nr:CbiX/SirB N-terminal domain-containing protein [Syntrophales bacterium]MDP3097494.1 CbiX/SirB N-terminal domain-containing protein [Syntrophales bacterium]